jgi:hypothetical protein
MGQVQFYKTLIERLIENDHDQQRMTRQQAAESAAANAAFGTSGRGLHLTPTKRKRISLDSNETKRVRYKCKMCDRKTAMTCSICKLDPEMGERKAGYCSSGTGRDCFACHMSMFH